MFCEGFNSELEKTSLEQPALSVSSKGVSNTIVSFCMFCMYCCFYFLLFQLYEATQEHREQVMTLQEKLEILER